MTPILYILAFAVGFLLVQLAIHLAWKRRRAQASIVSPTVESADRQMKALYSRAALEEMARQENPLFEMVRRHEEAVGTSAENRARHLFAIGSVETGTPLTTHAAPTPTAEEREQFARTMETVPMNPSGIVFKPGKPLSPYAMAEMTRLLGEEPTLTPVPADEPKDGES
jgi:hypothetical protein